MAAKDFCSDPVCAENDRVLMLEIVNTAIRNAVASSSHVSIDLVELLKPEMAADGGH